MAKGRRMLSTSRSERYLGSFAYTHGGETADASSELGEDEVWSTIEDTIAGEDQSADKEWNSRTSGEENVGFPVYDYSSSRRRPPTHASSRRHHRQVGGLSLAFEDWMNSSTSPRIVHQFNVQESVPGPQQGRHMAASAPVNVPDWSKIYRVDSVESLNELEDRFDETESEVVPPHEYLAREYRRDRKMAANSVVEGAGRTLKGRDLSRVRDAVWSRTGFDG